jgi:hypothetical protein
MSMKGERSYLPGYERIANKIEHDQALTSLERFIHKYEPDRPVDIERFRRALLDVWNEAITLGNQGGLEDTIERMEHFVKASQ